MENSIPLENSEQKVEGGLNARSFRAVLPYTFPLQCGFNGALPSKKVLGSVTSLAGACLFKGAAIAASCCYGDANSRLLTAPARSADRLKRQCF